MGFGARGAERFRLRQKGSSTSPLRLFPARALPRSETAALAPPGRCSPSAGETSPRGAGWRSCPEPLGRFGGFGLPPLGADGGVEQAAAAVAPLPLELPRAVPSIGGRDDEDSGDFAMPRGLSGGPLGPGGSKCPGISP